MKRREKHDKRDFFWLLCGVILSVLFFLCGGVRIIGTFLWEQYQKDMYRAFLPGIYINSPKNELETKSGEEMKTIVRRQSLDLARLQLLGIEEQEESFPLHEEEELPQEVLPMPETLRYFVPGDKALSLDWKLYQEEEQLIKEFFTIDSTTQAKQGMLSIDALRSPDLSIDREVEGPQILIYHTHSREGYANSIEGDMSTGVVGVGERLTKILTEEYGYNVYHLEDVFDQPDFTKAYSNALPRITEILAENPSIQVVLDLHRDDLPNTFENTKEIQGIPCARFMFFNGLSRTKKNGDLSYIPNENLAMNLAMSFQLEAKAKEYYPGLTRKIYLKGYRYNMHVLPRSVLLELGCQHNTFEQAANACYPIAHILDMVLRGEE